MTISVVYSFTGDADGACLTVYDPALREYKSETVYLGANHDGCIRAGGREGDATIALHAVPFADAAGTYTIILSARQTAGQAASNREPGQVKPMVQSKQTVELWPEAYNVMGYSQWPGFYPQSPEPAADYQEDSSLDGTRYEAQAVESNSVAALRAAMLRSAIVFVISHGNPGNLDLGGADPPGGPYTHRLYAYAGGNPDQPENDNYSIERMPRMPHLRFIFMDSCSSGAPNGIPSDLTAMLLSKGVACVAGWGTEVDPYRAAVFDDMLWFETMVAGASVGDAADVAYQTVVQQFYGLPGGTETFYASDPSLVLRPAGFGE